MTGRASPLGSGRGVGNPVSCDLLQAVHDLDGHIHDRAGVPFIADQHAVRLFVADHVGSNKPLDSFERDESFTISTDWWGLGHDAPPAGGNKLSGWWCVHFGSFFPFAIRAI